MILCSGNNKDKTQHPSIVFTDGKCPLCESIKHISYLHKKIDLKQTGSLDQTRGLMIDDNEQALSGLRDLYPKVSNSSQKLLDALRDELTGEIDFLKNVVSVKYIVIKLTIGGFSFYLTQSQIDAVEPRLIALKVEYIIEEVDGLNSFRQKFGV